MFRTEVVDKIKTHIFLFSNFVTEHYAVYEMIWKKNIYFRAGPATDDNMAQAHCVLGT